MIDDDEPKAEAEPAPVAPPSRQFPMDDLIIAVHQHACSIEELEAVAVRCGLRSAPIPERMMEAELFHALHRYLLLQKPHLPEIRRMLQRKPRRSYS